MACHVAIFFSEKCTSARTIWVFFVVLKVEFLVICFISSLIYHLSSIIYHLSSIIVYLGMVLSTM